MHNRHVGWVVVEEKCIAQPPGFGTLDIQLPPLNGCNSSLYLGMFLSINSLLFITDRYHPISIAPSGISSLKKWEGVQMIA